MSAHRFWQLFRALMIVDEGVRHCERKLDILIAHQGVELPPELVQAGKDLEIKRNTLQVALNAQAQQTEPIQKGQ